MHIHPLLLLTPYIVAFQPDSTNTTIRFGAGIGSYADVTRDCHGNIVKIEHIPFSDACIAIEHEEAPLHLSARAGIFSEERSEVQNTITSRSYSQLTRVQKQHTVVYANPNFGLHWKYFGFDLGCMYFDGGTTGDRSIKP